jgi:hypothetical protein
MICLSALLRDVKVALRGETGDRVAILTEKRELIFTDRMGRGQGWKMTEEGVEPMNPQRKPLTEERVRAPATMDYPTTGIQPTPVKRKPGRPRKNPVPA